jgi:hypothetical protein
MPFLLKRERWSFLGQGHYTPAGASSKPARETRRSVGTARPSRVTDVTAANAYPTKEYPKPWSLG